MSDAFETFEHAGLTCNVFQDEDGASFDPRKNYDHAGTMGFTHDLRREYIVGDETVSTDDWATDCRYCDGDGCKRCDDNGYRIVSPSEWARRELEAPIAFGLRFEEGHGYGASLYLEDDPESANGVVYLSRETLREEWGTGPAAFKAARACLRAEVEEYRSFLNGEVYFWNVEDSDGNILASVCGYIGDLDYVISEARSGAEEARDAIEAEARLAAHWAARDVETV